MMRQKFGGARSYNPISLHCSGDEKEALKSNHKFWKTRAGASAGRRTQKIRREGASGKLAADRES